MQGYEDLQNLQQVPLQWADDEDAEVIKKGGPVSSIEFPVSLDDCTKRSSLQASALERKKGYHSMPHSKQSSVTDARHRQTRNSVSITRPKLQNAFAQSNQPAHGDGEFTAPVSHNVWDESPVSLDQMSIRQRSMKSLQGFASAWVPGSIRSPYESDNEETLSLQKAEREKTEKQRPMRLDKRRLEKAVSLAMEAAQVSEQDERAWKEKRRRLASRQSGSTHKQKRLDALNSGRNTRFPWKLHQSSNKFEASGGGGAIQGALVSLRRHKYGEEESEDDDEDSSQGTKKAGLCQDEDDDDDSDRSDGTDDEDTPNDYSADLYVSSLGYLLAALNSRDYGSLGEKHRREMKEKLGEAMQCLETREDRDILSSDREEVIQLRVEKELLLLDRLHRRGQLPHSSRAHRAAQASSSAEQSRKQSVAGYLANSAIDLGLSLGAGALATATRGVASLLPVLTVEGADPKRDKVVNLTTFEADGAILRATEKEPGHRNGATVNVDEERDARSIITRSQWELTRTLAQSVASTMYSNFAAVAEQRRLNTIDAHSARQIALYSGNNDATCTTLNGSQDESDQLLIMAASLARSVKRSPLPSQVRALTSQVICLVGALNERYSLSKRSTDLALRKTGQALYFVRKNDLHVKALRTAWALVEASVAALEAYRDEEEWREAEKSSDATTNIEAPPAEVGQRGAQL
ncbi:hypothetical protein CBS101457_005532 [Exobasidium rhododendri]|nr:hypothetical protein CBS101457_005532 [Exobasidium rhododendri]